MRTYAEFISWFWLSGPGSLAPLPPPVRFRQFRRAYKKWLAAPPARPPVRRRAESRAAPLPYSISGLIDWFVETYGPLPPAREPALRESYWRLWDAVIDLHIRGRKHQAREGARILHRLGFTPPRSLLPWAS